MILDNRLCLDIYPTDDASEKSTAYATVSARAFAFSGSRYVPDVYTFECKNNHGGLIGAFHRERDFAPLAQTKLGIPNDSDTAILQLELYSVSLEGPLFYIGDSDDSDSENDDEERHSMVIFAPSEQLATAGKLLAKKQYELIVGEEAGFFKNRLAHLNNE